MTKILIIYTGGTIGMVHDTKSDSLKPFDFERITSQVPELNRFDYQISAHSFHPLIDSSNMEPQIWVELAAVIGSNYEQYDGFVVLHGTDTMSYTASALSFMLENLQKPIIFTGSQLPIGEIRTDAKENLITAIEIAALKKDNKSVIQEVCVFFDYKLFRGNRTSKFSSSKFEAFHSPNYPSIGQAGVHIKIKEDLLIPVSKGNLTVHKNLNQNIGIVKLFPGLSESFLNSMLNTEGLKAIVLETFGSGNAPTANWFINSLKKAIDKGIVIYNVTQCNGGSVEQGRYETSIKLRDIGVISGKDITTEAAVTKLMYLLGRQHSSEEIRQQLSISLRGEIS